MKRVTLIMAASVAALLLVLNAAALAQDNPQEKTYLTFSNAVEMPGVTLPAGTYVFRLADTPSRNVVQVLSQNEKEILGQWLFVQADRPDVSGDTVVMFKEAREGATPAVQYWYYPNERIGKEFVYPKDQASKIAARTASRVLSTEGAISSNSTVTSVDAQGQVTEWQRESKSADATLRDAPASAQPSAAAGSLAGNRGPDQEPPAAVGTSGSGNGQAVDSSAPRQTARAELPKTASGLPLGGIIGLLALAGALGTRAAARLL